MAGGEQLGPEEGLFLASGPSLAVQPQVLGKLRQALGGLHQAWGGLLARVCCPPLSLNLHPRTLGCVGFCSDGYVANLCEEGWCFGWVELQAVVARYSSASLERHGQGTLVGIDATSCFSMLQHNLKMLTGHTPRIPATVGPAKCQGLGKSFLADLLVESLTTNAAMRIRLTDWQPIFQNEVCSGVVRHRLFHKTGFCNLIQSSQSSAQQNTEHGLRILGAWQLKKLATQGKEHCPDKTLIS
jgi:hypothetical protein